MRGWENQLATHDRIQIWGWVEWAHLFYFQVILSLTWAKKKKREEEEEKKETSPRSAGKSFHTKEQDCTNKTDSVPQFQGFQLFFRRAQEGIGTETGLCVCVLNKYALSFYMILFQGPG